MLIHAPGAKPSASPVQSHRINRERSYTIHDATRELTIQANDTPLTAYSIARAGARCGTRPVTSIATMTAAAATK
jgi:hypothetical protein